MLIGRRIYDSGRSSLLGSSAVGDRSTLRPIHSPISFRRCFGSDYGSFPSGLNQEAIVLAMKPGGIACRNGGGSSQTSTAVMGRGIVSAPLSGGGDATLARLAGTKWMACAPAGIGSLIATSLRGTTFLSCSISIGSRPSADDIAYAVWGLDNGIEAGWTPRQIMRVVAAVLAGKVSGAGANAPVFRDVNDTKPRVSATTDTSGNRTAVTLDPS